jgi:hypothetical protein
VLTADIQIADRMIGRDTWVWMWGESRWAFQGRCQNLNRRTKEDHTKNVKARHSNPCNSTRQMLSVCYNKHDICRKGHTLNNVAELSKIKNEMINCNVYLNSIRHKWNTNTRKGFSLTHHHKKAKHLFLSNLYQNIIHTHSSLITE